MIVITVFSYARYHHKVPLPEGIIGNLFIGVTRGKPLRVRCAVTFGIASLDEFSR
jgi:hypothetical protein